MRKKWLSELFIKCFGWCFRADKIFVFISEIPCLEVSKFLLNLFFNKLLIEFYQFIIMNDSQAKRVNEKQCSPCLLMSFLTFRPESPIQNSKTFAPRRLIPIA